MNPEIAIIAGFDGSGGAGVLADSETVRSLGATPRVVVTALTAQSEETGFSVEPVSISMLKSQLDALFSGIEPKAIKVGMLPNQPVAEVVSAALKSRPKTPVALDPVLVASSGLALMEESCIEWIRDAFLSRMTLVTPNLDEVRRFTGLGCETREDMITAAEEFLSYGVRAVLIKGGHLANTQAVDCLLIEGAQPRWFESPRVEGVFRGTGCRLSSAIATRLAFGDDLPDAVETAKVYLTTHLGEQVE